MDSPIPPSALSHDEKEKDSEILYLRKLNDSLKKTLEEKRDRNSPEIKRLESSLKEKEDENRLLRKKNDSLRIAASEREEELLMQIQAARKRLCSLREFLESGGADENSYVVIEAYGQDLMSEETRRFEAAIRKYKKTVRDHRAIEREDENALHAKLHEKESELLYLSKMLTLQKSSLNSIDEAYIKVQGDSKKCFAHLQRSVDEHNSEIESWNTRISALQEMTSSLAEHSEDARNASTKHLLQLQIYQLIYDWNKGAPSFWSFSRYDDVEDIDLGEIVLETLPRPARIAANGSSSLDNSDSQCLSVEAQSLRDHVRYLECAIRAKDKILEKRIRIHHSSCSSNVGESQGGSQRTVALQNADEQECSNEGKWKHIIEELQRTLESSDNEIKTIETEFAEAKEDWLEEKTTLEAQIHVVKAMHDRRSKLRLNNNATKKGISQ